MVFSSSVFLMAFLPLTLLAYFAVPTRFVKARNAVLLAASLVFYGWGEPKYILVMLFSIMFNYVCGMTIGRNMLSENIRVWEISTGQNLCLFSAFLEI